VVLAITETFIKFIYFILCYVRGLSLLKLITILRKSIAPASREPRDLKNCLGSNSHLRNASGWELEKAIPDMVIFFEGKVNFFLKTSNILFEYSSEKLISYIGSQSSDRHGLLD
jgi:hypothetical protein